MGISRHIKPYGTISEPTVNQRVLGSSPRGGAKSENLIRNDKVFLFLSH